MVCHVFGKSFDIEGFFNYGAGVPKSFQRAFLTCHLILFVTNHCFCFFELLTIGLLSLCDHDAKI